MVFYNGAPLCAFRGGAAGLGLDAGEPHGGGAGARPPEELRTNSIAENLKVEKPWHNSHRIPHDWTQRHLYRPVRKGAVQFFSLFVT